MAVDWAPLVTPFLLPISFLMDLFQYYSIQWRYFMSWGKNTHQKSVAEVQRQVKEWRKEGRGRKMCTARPSWMSITQQKLGYKDKMYRISVDLFDVLEIDPKNMVVRVEPCVTIGFLNRLLVSQGYTLPIVPELDMLTIGGLIMGGGLESTSHKYGMFHHICTQYEVVTADGECVLADHENNSDLFHAIPMSYGTLGFLTSITIKMIPYKPYLRITYRPTYSLDSCVKLLEKETHKETDNDSVEGILYSQDTAVIMTGKFVEEREVEKDKINRLGLWFKPWFYLHVQSFLKKGESVEYVPTLHFHQRHNKPMFWLTKMWLPWAHNVIARFLTGWVLPVNTQLLKLIKETFVGNDYEDDFLLQDFMIPLKHVAAAVQLSDKLTNVWPVWAVPARLYHEKVPKCLLPRAGDIIYIDIGVYGTAQTPSYKGRDATLKEFEKFTLEHGGYQALYAETLMTYDEFCTMFEREMYDRVRNRIPLCQEAFPEVYEKVSREGRKGNWKPSTIGLDK